LDESDFELVEDNLDEIEGTRQETEEEKRRASQRVDWLKRQLLFLDKGDDLAKKGQWLLFFYFNSINSAHTDHRLAGQEKRSSELQKETRGMALDSGDIRLIRASWLPARRDPSGAGLLLFKR